MNTTHFLQVVWDRQIFLLLALACGFLAALLERRPGKSNIVLLIAFTLGVVLWPLSQFRQVTWQQDFYYHDNRHYFGVRVDQEGIEMQTYTLPMNYGGYDPDGLTMDDNGRWWPRYSELRFIPVVQINARLDGFVVRLPYGLLIFPPALLLAIRRWRHKRWHRGFEVELTTVGKQSA